MGCDIHMYVELKHEKEVSASGEWVLAVAEEAAYRHRDSHLFALLSGLDAEDLDVTPIAQARGLPSDVSVEVRRRNKRYGEGHTHSWLTVSEVLAFRWPAGVEQYFLGWVASLLGTTGAARTALSMWPRDEIRFVFWFDN